MVDGSHANELTILARTDPIPFDAIAVRLSLDPDLARRIQEALITIRQSEAGRKALAESTHGLTDFAAALDGTFNGVREIAVAAGLYAGVPR